MEQTTREAKIKQELGADGKLHLNNQKEALETAHSRASRIR